ncbi:MAG TPA: hypothetical protein ENG92_04900, partial [Thiolapillus brandeum]|nr:hypothetical protein [Thiolapillus brandeum]
MTHNNANTIATHLDKLAQSQPDAIAITAPGRAPLAYARLNRQINKMRNNLNNGGIGRNDRVAVVLPNGPEMAVTILGVMSGASCAPLNPGYQAAEFEFYLNDLEAKALVMEKGNDSPAKSVAVALGIPIMELVFLPEKEAGLFELEVTQPDIAKNTGLAGADDCALVLHTSGTTSRPKIVPLTQSNLCASAGHISNSLCLDRDDRCLNMMPLFHIHGLVAALLSSIWVGGSIVCTQGHRKDLFISCLREFRPTWYSAVPTIHQAILDEVSSSEFVTDSLRFIRSSSSALPPGIFKSLENSFKVPV